MTLQERKLKNQFLLPFKKLSAFLKSGYIDVCPRCYTEMGWTHNGWQSNRYWLCQECREETGISQELEPGASVPHWREV